MNHQKMKKKSDVILSGLIDATFELVTFWNDTVIFAAEWELENDYGDTCYDTNVTIHDDLTATVEQFKKDFFIMDCPPNSINEISESRSWELSKYEVSKRSAEIIVPFLETYLHEIRSGTATIKKLQSGSPTTTALDTLAMLEVHCEKGKFLIDSHREYELYDKTVTGFKDYTQDTCKIFERLKELSVRMGIELDTQPKKRGRIRNNDPKVVASRAKAFIAENRNWHKSRSRWKDMAVAIGFKKEGNKDLGRALRDFFNLHCKVFYEKIK